jgi:Transposase IS116/IS110/IS902 family
MTQEILARILADFAPPTSEIDWGAQYIRSAVDDSVLPLPEFAHYVSSCSTADSDSDTQPRQAVTAAGTGLYGMGPVGAARLLGDVGDVGRFASKAHFASWTGTAPIDALTGQQQRHHLSLAANRRINLLPHAADSLRCTTDLGQGAGALRTVQIKRFPAPAATGAVRARTWERNSRRPLGGITSPETRSLACRPATDGWSYRWRRVPSPRRRDLTSVQPRKPGRLSATSLTPAGG